MEHPASRHGLALGRSISPRPGIYRPLPPPPLPPPVPERGISEQLSEALQPLLVQLGEQDALLKHLQLVAALHEEAKKNDDRLRLQEAFLRQHAESLTKPRHSTHFLDSLMCSSGPTTAAADLVGEAVAPLEALLVQVQASLSRLEGAVDRRRPSKSRSCAVRGDNGDAAGSGVPAPSPAPSKRSSRPGSQQPSRETPDSSILSGPSRDHPDTVGPLIASAGPEQPRLLDAPTQASSASRQRQEQQEWQQEFTKEEREERQQQLAEFSRSETMGGRRSRSFLGMPLEEVDMTLVNRPPTCIRRRGFHFACQALHKWQRFREPYRPSEMARHVDGICFKSLCSLVIFANIVFMIYTTNHNMDSILTHQERRISLSVELGNIAFISFFSFELLLKIAVHRWYFFIGPELHWNLFDLAVVLISVYSQFFGFLLSSEGGKVSNASALRALRVLKLAKVLRVVQLMRIFNELRMILHAVIGSSITLVWSLVVLFFCYYLFALAFVQLLANWLYDQASAVSVDLKRDISMSFGNVGTAMLVLLKVTSGGSTWGELYALLQQTDGTICILFLLFMGFMKVSLQNILTGIFVEQTIRLAQPDLQVKARIEQEKERNESIELKRVLEGLDKSSKGTISPIQFQKLFDCTHLRYYFAALGVDIRRVEDVFVDGDEDMDIDSFVDFCIKMRGAASGVGQHNLLLEANLLKHLQADHCLAVMEKLDTLLARVPQDLGLSSPRSRLFSKE